MQERLEEYRNLLNSMYGKNLVSNLITLKNRSLIMRKPHELIKSVLSYDREVEESRGCKGKINNNLCSDIYETNKFNFIDRPMEFPSWREGLNFNNKSPAKKLMIIGEAAGPSIKTHINICFGLSNLFIDEKGNLNNADTDSLFSQLSTDDTIKISLRKWGLGSLEEYKKGLINQLWIYLNELFSENIINDIYVTDLVKCNNRSGENKKGNFIWTFCIKNCLINLLSEIKLIQPEVIIFQGLKSYYGLKKELKKNNFNKKKDVISAYYQKYKEFKFSKSLKYGIIQFEDLDLEITFLRIYHQKYVNSYMPNQNDERQIYKDSIALLIKEKIIPILKG